MPRPERSPGRRPPSREPYLRLLVVCGAEKTEKAYLTGLRDSRKRTAVNVRLVERPRTPDQVVGYARDHCGYRDFDEAWCVVDVDRFEIEGQKVTAACAAATAAGIRLAVSHPCFEYWLLLHHTDSSTPTPKCDTVVNRLRRYVSSYNKTKLRFDDFRLGVVDAVARARKRDHTGEDWRRNPSTGVWRLVEKIIEQS
jgi:hypothetical protein